MDSASQFSSDTNHGRNGSQSTNNDRQPSEFSNPSSFNHPRQNNHPPVCVAQSRQTTHDRRNSTSSEQKSNHVGVQFQKPAALHFDYHSRYPSPPSTRRSPNSLSSSPLLHPSPTLHRTNGSSSSAGSQSMITLPPLSTVGHPPRVVDQSPNVELSSLPTIQRKPPSIAQLTRNHPEQGAIRRHTLDNSGYVPDPQMVPGSRKRTSSTVPSPTLRGNPHHSIGTQQVPPLPPPQQGQTNKLVPMRYSPPPSISRRENPPIAMSPGPMSPSMSQPPQISHSSQDGPPPPPPLLTSADEAADAALEPLRLGFENIWAQTVQNVRQIMGKMQMDFSRLNAAEGRKNVNLMRCLVSTTEKLKGQEWAVEELRKENSTLMQKVLENEQLRRETNQKRTMMDSLSQENHELRRENEELRTKNEEVKEALTKAAEFIFQYKEELAKVRADAETFRKCREASVLSANDQTLPAATDLHREITRLHAEKERERIFNDAVKQLRALTAMEEDSPNATMRERDSEEEKDVKTVSIETDNRRSVSSSLEAPTSVQKNPSPPPVDEQQPRQPTPPSATVSSDKEEKCKVEDDDCDDMDIEMDDEDDVIIIPPTTATTTPNPPAHNPDAGQDTQRTDEYRNSKEEQEPQSDLEMQRQRQRQALRGPTPPSPQPRARKTSLIISKTGVKRDREEYEEGQVDEDEDEDHHGGRNDEPGIILEKKLKDSPVHDSSSTKKQALVPYTDADDNSDGEIVILEEQEKKTKVDKPKEQKDKKKGSTDGKQVIPQSRIKKKKIPITAVKVPNPKAVGGRSYYRDFISPPVSLTSLRSFVTTPQQSTMSQFPPSPRPRLQKKLGINHMDLLYKTERESMVCRICLSLEKTVDATTGELRKVKTTTQKFPLNASWADLINHCQTEHTKACEDMEKLSPSQLAEMKQRTR